MEKEVITELRKHASEMPEHVTSLCVWSVAYQHNVSEKLEVKHNSGACFATLFSASTVSFSKVGVAISIRKHLITEANKSVFVNIYNYLARHSVFKNVFVDKVGAKVWERGYYLVNTNHDSRLIQGALLYLRVLAEYPETSNVIKSLIPHLGYAGKHKYAVALVLSYSLRESTKGKLTTKTTSHNALMHASIGAIKFMLSDAVYEDEKKLMCNGGGYYGVTTYISNNDSDSGGQLAFAIRNICNKLTDTVLTFGAIVVEVHNVTAEAIVKDAEVKRLIVGALL